MAAWAVRGATPPLLRCVAKGVNVDRAAAVVLLRDARRHQVSVEDSGQPPGHSEQRRPDGKAHSHGLACLHRPGLENGELVGKIFPELSRQIGANENGRKRTAPCGRWVPGRSGDLRLNLELAAEIAAEAALFLALGRFDAVVGPLIPPSELAVSSLVTHRSCRLSLSARPAGGGPIPAKAQ